MGRLRMGGRSCERASQEMMEHVSKSALRLAYVCNDVKAKQKE